MCRANSRGPPRNRCARVGNGPSVLVCHTMLPGQMMDYPLTLTHFLERARTFFPDGEVVSRLPDGSLHRYNYASFHRRVAQLAGALCDAGIGPGDRVASLCWN